ncbi:MAG: ROK family protein [Phycisphaerales bacterium]|nr:ROK family protein [Phycisphaerales bacterium]MCB9854057.1 ROK family protein [Phycisphaerales bacterium]MCB9864367.1 ROK family protein [Phycisphaerales bacterium]
MHATSERAAIGIDIGGTAIKGGAVTSTGHVLAQRETPTDNHAGIESIIAQIALMVSSLQDEDAVKSREIVGLGVGVPGLVDYRDGRVINCANLPGWENVQIAKLLDDRTGLGVSMENDANNAALAEARIGAGRGSDSMALLTLGTGVGSGLIICGSLWHGAGATAGEIGHTIVQPGGRRCTCGQQGCLEVYASASATARRVVEAILTGAKSILSERVNSGHPLNSADVVEAAKAGDAVGRQAWDESCKYLAMAAINLQHTLDPKCIVLGGGMSAAGDFLLANVNRQCAEMMSSRLGTLPDIRLAKLGNDAGFIGAALNALDA